MNTVLYVGNFEPDHSTENEIRRAFEHLGWTVDQCQERTFVQAFARGAYGPIFDRALAADLVVHTMTQGSYPDPELVTRLWKSCDRAGVPTASIHLDLFYGLASPKDQGPQRQDLPREHPMFRVAHVFTPDGGHDAEWKRDGVNHHWLPPGVSHTECVDLHDEDPTGPAHMMLTNHAGEIVWASGSDRYLVGFAGSDGYHPEWPHRPQLVAWLRDTYKDRFLHIGGSSTPRVTGLALNRVYASVPVWVGDSCMTRPDFAYWSDRVPETWGRGGFLIHPEVHALGAHYEPAGWAHPGSEWVAGDFDALHATIEDYLAYPSTREDVRRDLGAHTRARDTYVNRVQSMLDVIGLDTEVSAP